MILAEINLHYIELALLLIVITLITIIISSFKKLRVEVFQKSRVNVEGAQLKLQAIERLTLFAERSGLKNLVERIGVNGMTAAELHHTLTQTLKAEYDYNQSQQIYISPEVWNSITRLKDQNIYIINQITVNLPPHATGLDLGKLIIEYSSNPNAELNVIVLDALQYEAKKILN